jgi:hypothetical protein
MSTYYELEATEKKTLVSEYLAARPLLTLYFDQAQGMGHQASTLNLLRRVIQLGFKGTVQVYWNGELALDKLETLLPGFEEARQGTKLMVFQGIELQLEPKPPQEVELALCGGTDGGRVNLCTTHKAQCFLKVQPYQWRGTKSNPAYDEAIFANGAAVDLRDAIAGFTTLSYYLAPPAMDAKAWEDLQAISGSLFPSWEEQQEIAETEDDSDDDDDEEPNERLDLVKTLRWLEEQLANDHIDLCPVYGIGDDQSIEWPISTRPENILLTLVESIKRAEQIRGRNAVVLVLAELGHKTYRKMVGPEVFEVRKSVFGLPGTIDTMTKGVLIVPIGRVPPRVFNYIYSLATLPFVFEGKGTANLAVNLGKPFFYLRSRFETESLYPKLDGPWGYCEEIAKALTDGAYNACDKITQFILDCCDQSTEVAQYFALVGKVLHSEEDKLVCAIWYFLQQKTMSMSIGTIGNTINLSPVLTTTSTSTEKPKTTGGEEV